MSAAPTNNAMPALSAEPQRSGQVSDRRYEELTALSGSRTAASPLLSAPFPIIARSMAGGHQYADKDGSRAIQAAAEAERQEQLAMLRLAETSGQVDTGLQVTNYAEDKAIREASLADRLRWDVTGEAPRFAASNGLSVYYGDPEQPMSLEDANKQLLRVSEGTVLTARIAMGLYSLRRYDGRLAKNGSAAVSVNEFLDWRGFAKRTRPAADGSMQRWTEGYRPEQKEQVRDDFALLRNYFVRGFHTVTVNGRSRSVGVAGSYWNVSTVLEKNLWGEEEVVGFLIRPGDWINTYEEADNRFLAQMDRAIFRLDPGREQHALRLALYLSERWREKASKREYAEPITMQELLDSSVIPVDVRNLTNRFAPSVERALETLRGHGIVGAYQCLTPPDRSKRNWGREWLASKWRILPPAELVQWYELNIRRQQPPQLPPAKDGKRGASK